MSRSITPDFTGCNIHFLEDTFPWKNDKWRLIEHVRAHGGSVSPSVHRFKCTHIVLNADDLELPYVAWQSPDCPPKNGESMDAVTIRFGGVLGADGSVQPRADPGPKLVSAEWLCRVEGLVLPQDPGHMFVVQRKVTVPPTYVAPKSEKHTKHVASSIPSRRVSGFGTAGQSASQTSAVQPPRCISPARNSIRASADEHARNAEPKPLPIRSATEHIRALSITASTSAGALQGANGSALAKDTADRSQDPRKRRGLASPSGVTAQAQPVPSGASPVSPVASTKAHSAPTKEWSVRPRPTYTPLESFEGKSASDVPESFSLGSMKFKKKREGEGMTTDASGSVAATASRSNTAGPTVFAAGPSFQSSGLLEKVDKMGEHSAGKRIPRRLKAKSDAMTASMAVLRKRRTARTQSDPAIGKSIPISDIPKRNPTSTSAAPQTGPLIPTGMGKIRADDDACEVIDLTGPDSDTEIEIEHQQARASRALSVKGRRPAQTYASPSALKPATADANNSRSLQRRRPSSLSSHAVSTPTNALSPAQQPAMIASTARPPARDDATESGLSMPNPPHPARSSAARRRVVFSLPRESGQSTPDDISMEAGSEPDVETERRMPSRVKRPRSVVEADSNHSGGHEEAPERRLKIARRAATAAKGSIARQYTLTSDIEEDGSDGTGADDTESEADGPELGRWLDATDSSTRSMPQPSLVPQRDTLVRANDTADAPLLQQVQSNESDNESDLSHLDTDGDPDATLVDEPTLATILGKEERSEKRPIQSTSHHKERTAVQPEHQECFDAFVAHFRAWRPVSDKKGNMRLKAKGGRLGYMMSLQQKEEWPAAYNMWRFYRTAFEEAVPTLRLLARERKQDS